MYRCFFCRSIPCLDSVRVPACLFGSFRTIGPLRILHSHRQFPYDASHRPLDSSYQLNYCHGTDKVLLFWFTSAGSIYRISKIVQTINRIGTLTNCCVRDVFHASTAWFLSELMELEDDASAPWPLGSHQSEIYMSRDASRQSKWKWIRPLCGIMIGSEAQLKSHSIQS